MTFLRSAAACSAGILLLGTLAACSAQPTGAGTASGTGSSPATTASTPAVSESVTPVVSTSASPAASVPAGANVTYKRSPDYYATVFGLDVQGDVLSLSIDAVGRDDLRRPQTSCVKDSAGHTVQVANATLTTDEPTHYVGLLSFSTEDLTAAPWSFLYSCQDDYNSLELSLE